MNFLSYIASVIPVSDSLGYQISACTSKIKATKGEVLVTTGDRCSEIYFIEKGLMRGYYFNEEKEITNWFAREGEFATCFYSFVSRESSFESIQVLEDAELVSISFSDLQSLYKSFPETERIGRLLTEQYYLKLEGRFLSIQFKTAKERYQNLMSSNPSLIQRASLGQIASYLGITQETLSRIRAEM